MPEDSNQNSQQTSDSTTADTTATDTTQTTALGGDQTDDTTATDTTATDDLATLFTPEEVTAKKEAATAAKAEETRRAALTDAERAAEDAAKAEAEAANKVPENYEFKIPDGMEMDTELLAEATPIFKELELSQEKAQKLMDVYAEKIYPAIMKRNIDAWQAQTEAWKTEVKGNKEINLDDNGQNLDGIRAINSLLSREEATSFRADLDKYGVGNLPGLNLMFARMAGHLKEDTIDVGQKGSTTATGDIAHRMFPGLE